LCSFAGNGYSSQENSVTGAMRSACVCTLGMIPIAPTVFWGPMAYSIMGGMAVATVLTLVFLPALYVTWFRIKAPQGSVQKIDLPQTAMAQPLT
jgi:hypothetical protein